MSRTAKRAVPPHADTPRLGFLFLLGCFATFTVMAACLIALDFTPATGTSFPWARLACVGLFAVAVPFLILWLTVTRWRGDAGLLGCVLLLTGVGIATQLRMGNYMDALDHPERLLPLALGLVALLLGATLTTNGRAAWTARLGWFAWLGATAALGAIFFMGRRYRGGIYLDGNINPSEIIKPLLTVFLAAFLSKHHEAFSKTRCGIPCPTLRSAILFTLCWSVPLVLTVLLNDLGLAALLCGVALLMLFAATQRAGYLICGTVLAGVAGWAAYTFSTHTQARFDVWMHPFTDPTGAGWQVLQGLSAMFSGGLWGSGLGDGAVRFVPIVSSDFVYAALAEETGLIGCALILTLYATLFSRGFRAAGTAATHYEELLTAGLTAMLAVQTVLNLGGVTKALPMTGITLPLISHGGSSLVITLFMCGLLIGLSSPKTK